MAIVRTNWGPFTALVRQFDGEFDAIVRRAFPTGPKPEPRKVPVRGAAPQAVESASTELSEQLLGGRRITPSPIGPAPRCRADAAPRMAGVTAETGIAEGARISTSTIGRPCRKRCPSSTRSTGMTRPFRPSRFPLVRRRAHRIAEITESVVCRETQLSPVTSWAIAASRV